MVHITALLSAAAVVQTVLCTPISRSSYSIKEKHFVPSQWRSLGRAPANNVIHLQIGVKQGQFGELERHLYEVSDPDHHRYGQHLSVDEVNDLVKPSEEALDLVHEWLLENDITDFNHSPSKDWVEIYIPVDEAERLLDTEYHVYEHEDGSKLIRTPNYSLPSHLHEHIDTIQPTTSFFRTRPERSTALQLPPVIPAGYKPPTDPEIAKVCNVSSVTPQCFMHLYSTLGYKTKSKGKSKVSFTNYLGEVPIRPDTALFMKKYRPEGVSAAFEFKQQSIAGGPVQDGVLTPAQAGNGTSREANLDVQAILGISYPLPVSSWSTGGEPPFNPDLNTPDNTNEPYLVWQNYVLSQRSLPQVISNSYADDEQTVPKAYAERVCKQFALLGARGVSVLFASGDRGVGVNGTCLSNDGKNTRKFIPLFPSGCPYVTTIGATHEFQPEVVAFRAATYNATGGKIREIYASGSGFSNYFSRPAYQKKVVDAYVKDLKGKFDGLYNKGGRGYPDIAAQGQYFAYFWNQTEGVISGTSASTPLMSGIIALVNDALIASGKPALGFLNPFIYSKGYKGFTDIVSGSGVGCETDGFPATKGWDPVTGFGTPVFPKIVSLAKGGY